MWSTLEVVPQTQGAMRNHSPQPMVLRLFSAQPSTQALLGGSHPPGSVLHPVDGLPTAPLGAEGLPEGGGVCGRREALAPCLLVGAELGVRDGGRRQWRKETSFYLPSEGGGSVLMRQRMSH